MANQDSRVQALADVIRSALPADKIEALAELLAPAKAGLSNADIEADKALRFLHSSFQSLGAKVSNLQEVKERIVKISQSDLNFALDGFGIARDLAQEEVREQSNSNNSRSRGVSR